MEDDFSRYVEQVLADMIFEEDCSAEDCPVHKRVDLEQEGDAYVSYVGENVVYTSINPEFETWLKLAALVAKLGAAFPDSAEEAMKDEGVINVPHIFDVHIAPVGDKSLWGAGFRTYADLKGKSWYSHEQKVESEFHSVDSMVDFILHDPTLDDVEAKMKDAHDFAVILAADKVV